MKKIVVAFIALFYALDLFAFFSADKAFVFPLKPSKDSQYSGWIGVGAAEMINDDLALLGDYEKLSIYDLQQSEEHPYSYKKLMSLQKEEKEKFQEEYDVDLVCFGEYNLQGDNLTLVVQCNDSDNEFRVEKKTNLATLTLTLSDLSAQIAQKLHKEEKLEQRYSNDPSSTIALQYYAKGLLELYRYNDEVLEAKQSVKHLNTDKKAAMIAKIKQLQSQGKFDITALQKTMSQLNSNVYATAKKASKTVDRKHLYNATHFFKKGIEVDKEYGKIYAALAQTIYTTTKKVPLSAPPKSYVEDLCKQAEEAKVAASCRDEVFDFKSPDRSNRIDVDECKQARKDYRIFKEYALHPQTTYNYSANLAQLLSRVEDGMKCLDSHDLNTTLLSVSQLISDHYKSKDMQSYVEHEYTIARLLEKSNATQEAMELFHTIEDALASYSESDTVQKKPTSQEEVTALLRKKMGLAIQAQSGDDYLALKKKYQLKIYNHLASLYAQQHKRVEAQKYLELLEGFSAEQQIRYSEYIRVSKAYYDLKEYNKALEIAKIVLKEEGQRDMGAVGRQTEFIKLYTYMAKVLMRNKKLNEALEYCDKARTKTEYLRSFINTTQEKYLKILRHYEEEIEGVELAALLLKHNPDEYPQIYAKVADKKSRLLYTQNALHSMIHTQLNRSVKPILEEIKKLKIQVHATDDETKKAQLRAQILHKEGQLTFTENINNIVDRKDALKIENLYKKIPQDTAVVDFFAVQDHYYVFVIHRDSMEFVDLGEQKQIDAMVHDKSFITSDELYQKLFSKVTIDERKLIIIPDGHLYLLPFEALNSGNGFFIQDKTISYLPSILMLRNVANTKMQSIDIFANPNYEEKVEVHKEGTRALRALRGVQFTPLPGTMLEAKKISTIARKSNLNLTLYTQEQANESNFASHTEADILHIATHGYFIEGMKGYEATGIVLSGANTSIKQGYDNGIISAQKILDSYNFSTTSLVVLSACDTGMGEYSVVNGVQSLGSAFMMVGAKSVVMNLWEIPDLQTAYMMKLFYKNMLQKGMDKDEALREAKLTMISKGEPYTAWAALLLFGR